MSVTSLVYQTSIICALFAIRVAEYTVCNGTTNADTIPGGHRARYEYLRTMYTNCTHVATNLEIVYLRQNDEVTTYDLSFLKTIRYVRGYVLIAGIYVDIHTMPLDNLQVIRGWERYRDHETDKRAALAVINNPGIHRLHLSKLSDISHGTVLFNHNVNMKYVDRINWRHILRFPPATATLINGYVYPANSSAALNCIGGHGWDDNPLLCQPGLNHSCNSNCQGRCFVDDTLRDNCCSRQCAIGCSGDYADECYDCTNFKHGNDCVVECPWTTVYRWPICFDIPRGGLVRT